MFEEKVRKANETLRLVGLPDPEQISKRKAEREKFGDNDKK